MLLGESITLGSFALVITGFTLKTYLDVNKKIDRTYQRLDETKKNQEEGFVRKDICMILHKQIDSKLSEISSDIKILIKNGNHKKDDE